MDVDQWRYVASKDNPADHASRGLSVEELTAKGEWLQGPEFLWKHEFDWPTYSDTQMFDNSNEIQEANEVLVQSATVQEQLSSSSEPDGMTAKLVTGKMKHKK